MKFSQNAPLPGTTTQLRERNATACVESFLLPRCGCWNHYTLLFVKKYKINFFGIPIVKANHENVKRSLWNGQKKNHRKSTFTFVRQQSNCSANFSQYFRSADTLTLVAYFWQHIQLTYSPDNPTTACHTFDHCNSNQFRHRLLSVLESHERRVHINTRNLGSLVVLNRYVSLTALCRYMHQCFN